MSKADKRENIIMVSLRHQSGRSLCPECSQIASEPLTFEKADWMEIRTNYMVVITPKMNLLQIPIIDRHFAPPMTPEYRRRGTEYAEAKGLLSPTERRARANSRTQPLLSDAGTDSSLPVPPESATAAVH